MADLVNMFFILIQLTILGRIILTLVLSLMRDAPPALIAITQVFVQVTEPILAPIRRVLPTFGMLDFSPMVAIILLIFIHRFVMSVLPG